MSSSDPPIRVTPVPAAFFAILSSVHVRDLNGTMVNLSAFLSIGEDALPGRVLVASRGPNTSVYAVVAFCFMTVVRP